MANRIRMDWNQLDEVESGLKRLAASFDSISSRIRGVPIERQSGSEVKMSLSSAGLTCTECSFGGDTAEECLLSIASAVRSLGDYVVDLKRKVVMAADRFAMTERSLISRFDGLIVPDTLYKGVAQSMGYGSDPAGWTPAMRHQMNQVMREANVVTEGDMTILSTPRRVLLYSTMGLLGGYVVEKAINDKNYFATQLFIPDEGEGLLPDFSYTSYGEQDVKKVGNETITQKASINKIELVSEGRCTAGDTYSSKDGNEFFAGLAGKLGLSYSAFSAEVTSEYELSDNVKLSYGAPISAGELNAGIEGKLGFTNGNFDASIEAGAEAIALKGGVVGGADLGYVKGKVEGTGIIGAGIYADVGFENGVLKYKMTQAVGVGYSVSGEIDFTGLGKLAGDIQQGVSEGIASWAQM